MPSCGVVVLTEIAVSIQPIGLLGMNHVIFYEDWGFASQADDQAHLVAPTLPVGVTGFLTAI
jgi:hypothetical protein